MSQLDQLDPDVHVGMSGVPMRPRAAPPAPDPMAAMANMFAAANEKLAVTLADALTSRPTAGSATEAPRAMTMSFSRGANGTIDSGMVSNGVTTWRLTFTRTDGRLTAHATPEN